MNIITVFSRQGKYGTRGGSNSHRLGNSVLPLLSSLLLSLLVQPAVAAQAYHAHAGIDGIFPISLGEPAGCFIASGRTLSNGSYPQSLVVAGDALCSNDASTPYYWHNNQWVALSLPEAGYAFGYAESVSDDLGSGPTFTVQLYRNGEWDTWALGPGALMSKLALLDGTNHIDRAVITSEGNHIVGSNSANQQAVAHAVRWARDGNGWGEPAAIAPGSAVAATSNGATVIGNGVVLDRYCNNEPWVWTDAAGGGSRVDLDPDSAAYDITHSGSMIVGCRLKPCAPGKNCSTYPAPVYWSRQNGQWIRHDLEALDGVDSEAVAVAEVGGQPIILGYGFTNQRGGILRVVVWIPEADGSYGAPVRLEALGGNFDSVSWPNDINRQGVVLGWSETEPFGNVPPVLWSLFSELPFQINAGVSDAWFNSATDGQGFFIIVWEDIQRVFLGWFTYETERPDPTIPVTLGEAGHRWLTAEGYYLDNRAEMTVYMTQGGVFDNGSAAAVSVADGTMVLEFDNCLSGTLSYDIPSAGVAGVVPIQRITHDHVAHCEGAAAQAQMALVRARADAR